MRYDIPIYIGEDALARLLDYCAAQSIDALTLVADQNTYAALGQVAEHTLRTHGYDVHRILLYGEEIVADERAIVQLLEQMDTQERVFLAVGAGTITDLVRFVSHRARLPFISLPTAPSVDGYTSIGAPLVLDRVKRTLIAQPPRAVFADLPTLCAAPHRLIAAGLGDILGKFTSLADWRLGHLICNEEYDEALAQRARRALDACVQDVAAIGRAEPAAVRRLMEALVESGLCMLEFGKTTLASGAEHHASHFWEMKRLWEGRPSLLHGAKVGVATVLVASLYDQIKQLTRAQVAERMARVAMPERAVEIQIIRQVYGPIAEAIIAEQSTFLDMDATAYAALQQRVLDNWDAVQEIAATVPPAEQIEGMLAAADAPTRPSMLGLSNQEVELAMCCSHYLRNRFTVARLARMLGLL
ncbi:MAG: sn-glycerol-1-phosphate dehydrogenase [Anaerolineae bacterium]|nr:sn-glycerol-1-phosphate dehydrogenase [Anaerolineae bacterium]MDW8070866.1 sn-glycerol-1-phosphate dehydrogenase [Anaerolineae bacterium]